MCVKETNLLFVDWLDYVVGIFNSLYLLNICLRDSLLTLTTSFEV